MNRFKINKKTFIKSAGLLAILSAIGFGLTLSTPDRVFYAWTGLSGAVLAGPAYMGVYMFLENDKNASIVNLAAFLMMAGLPLVAGIYLFAYVDAILEIGIYQSEVGNMILLAIDGGSSLTYGAGLVFFSIASRRTTLPEWFSWLGIVSGILGMFWLGFFWAPGFAEGEIGFWIPVVGLMLALIWQIILGVFMLRARE